MRKITYRQAAELLGVQYETIKNAVFYNRLTKCATSSSEAMLLKEQVELFKNKRISTKKLSLEEMDLWQEYKKIAENTELLSLATRDTTTNEPASVLIAREIAKSSLNTKADNIENLAKAARELLESFDEAKELMRRKLDALHPLLPLALK